jgi:hypothetical protein
LRQLRRQLSGHGANRLGHLLQTLARGAILCCKPCDEVFDGRDVVE